MSDGLSILLAEDSPVIQRMLTAMLAREGHTVEAVGNGRDAVGAIQFGTYDLILMDLRMPEMDGFEATREIRRLAIEQPPIVALTGDDDAATQQACADAGMNGHLMKPIVFHDMEKMIASLTGG